MRDKRPVPYPTKPKLLVTHSTELQELFAHHARIEGVMLMNRMKSNIEILSADEVQMIHRAALNVLAKTGFHMPNDECLKRCEKAGAVVDTLQGVVRIPVPVMEDLLADMKKQADLQDAPDRKSVV